jgi:hypothetical protein
MKGRPSNLYQTLKISDIFTLFRRPNDEESQALPYNLQLMARERGIVGEMGQGPTKFLSFVLFRCLQRDV